MDHQGGGIKLGTDSYFPPEVKVRLVRLVSNRDCVNLGTGECTRCISYAIFGQYNFLNDIFILYVKYEFRWYLF